MSGFRQAFWRFAYKRYRGRRPSRLFELLLFSWATLFLAAYGGALIADFRYGLGFVIPGLFVVGLPLTFGLMHRRIRLERAKGPDALYRKRLATTIPVR